MKLILINDPMHRKMEEINIHKQQFFGHQTMKIPIGKLIVNAAQVKVLQITISFSNGYRK